MKAYLKAVSAKWVWLMLLVAIVAITLFQLSTMDKSDIQVPDFIAFLVEPGTHPGWFFGLLASLPMLGFPISVFCLLAGIKFGVLGGTVAIGLAMAVHLLVAYWLPQPAYLAMSGLLAVILLWRHADNIRRLRRGEEDRIRLSSQ